MKVCGVSFGYLRNILQLDSLHTLWSCIALLIHTIICSSSSAWLSSSPPPRLMLWHPLWPLTPLFRPWPTPPPLLWPPTRPPFPAHTPPTPPPPFTPLHPSMPPPPSTPHPMWPRPPCIPPTLPPPSSPLCSRSKLLRSIQWYATHFVNDFEP